jgi:N-acetyltransferase
MTSGTGPLGGRRVRLEPLSTAHVEGLATAAGEGRSTFALAAVPDGEKAVAGYVAELLAQAERGEAVPFAQVLTESRRVVGATRFLNFRRWPAGPLFAVEIGGTWLAPSAQRTGVNTEAKLLLMGHAFEGWGVGRVDIKTDARNARARTAISALGASFEGVLRRWQPSQARDEEHLLRDTAMYSVVAEDWPAVRAALEKRLSQSRPGR